MIELLYFWATRSWTKTSYSKNLAEHLTRECITHCAQPIHVLDVGCGDGTVTHKLLSAVNNPLAVECVLLDNNHHLLENCYKSVLPIAGAVKKVLGDMNDLLDILENDQEIHPPDLVIFSSSFHQIANHRKIDILSYLFNQGASVVISESSVDFSNRKRFDRTLLKESFRFYSWLLIRSIRSVDGIVFSIGVVIPEFIRVVFFSLDRRGEYHLRSRDWMTIVDKSGGFVLNKDSAIRRNGSMESVNIVAKKMP